MNRLFLVLVLPLLLTGSVFGKRLSMEDTGDGNQKIEKSNFLERYEQAEKLRKARGSATPQNNSGAPTEVEVPEWVNNGSAIFKNVPSEIILTKKYVFVIPPHSDNISNDAYNDILKKLAAQGYIVVSNPLDSTGNSSAIIEKTLSDINFLLNGKVQPGNIVLLGMSPVGGSIVLRLASKINNQDLKVVLVAAIPRKDTDGLLPADSRNVSGNIYNIYDKEDTENGSAKDFFKKLSGSRFFGEKGLKSGAGNKMSINAVDSWLTPAMKWIK